MRNLPQWAMYVITGLGVLVVALASVSGTLIVNDRATITKAFDKMDRILEEQNKQIDLIAKHNEKQNHIIDKMCWLMTFDHKQRMQLLDKYPLMNPKQ